MSTTASRQQRNRSMSLKPPILSHGSHGRTAPSGGADSVRPLQLAHLKLYLENAIELEAHRHGVFNGCRSRSLLSVGGSDESAIRPRY